jgi:hypothetical protein
LITRKLIWDTEEDRCDKGEKLMGIVAGYALYF